MLFLQTSLLSSAVHDCHDSQLQTKSNNTLTAPSAHHDTMKNHPNHALWVGLFCLCLFRWWICNDLWIYGISECGFWILALIPEGSAKSHACSSQESSNSVNRRLEATVVCRTTSTEVSLGDPKFRKTVTCRIHLLTQVEYALYFELEIQQISWNERAI